LILAVPARAADFAAGVAAYDDGDFATALAEWLPLARDGDPAAQRNIGHLYRNGLGVDRDPAYAAEWYERAANAGLSRAQANLGALYLTGDGVAQDFSEAARWFTAASVQGHVIAQFYLGMLYENGLGIAKNLSKAMALYNLAAEADYLPAQRARARLTGLDDAEAEPGPAAPNFRVERSTPAAD
jgi:hypothetical protein